MQSQLHGRDRPRTWAWNSAKYVLLTAARRSASRGRLPVAEARNYAVQSNSASFSPILRCDERHHREATLAVFGQRWPQVPQDA